jgi:hypothetical protein
MIGRLARRKKACHLSCEQERIDNEQKRLESDR